MFYLWTKIEKKLVTNSGKRKFYSCIWQYQSYQMPGIALKKYPADLALVACFFVSDVDDMSIANY